MYRRSPEVIYRSLDKEFKKSTTMHVWLRKHLQHILDFREHQDADLCSFFVKIYEKGQFCKELVNYVKSNASLKQDLQTPDVYSKGSKFCLLGLILNEGSSVYMLFPATKDIPGTSSCLQTDMVIQINVRDISGMSFEVAQSQTNVTYTTFLSHTSSLKKNFRYVLGETPAKGEGVAKRGRKTSKDDSDSLDISSSSSASGDEVTVVESGTVEKAVIPPTDLDDEQILELALEIYKKSSKEKQASIRESFVAVSNTQAAAAMSVVEKKRQKELRKLAIAVPVSTILEEALKLISDRRTSDPSLKLTHWDLENVTPHLWNYIGSGKRFLLSKAQFDRINEAIGNVFFVWRVLQYLYHYKCDKKMKDRPVEDKIGAALMEILPEYDTWIEMGDGRDEYMESGLMFSYIKCGYQRLETSVEYRMMPTDLKTFHADVTAKLAEERWPPLMVTKMGLIYLNYHPRHEEWLQSIEQSKEMAESKKNHRALPETHGHAGLPIWILIPTLESLGFKF